MNNFGRLSECFSSVDYCSSRCWYVVFGQCINAVVEIMVLVDSSLEEPKRMIKERKILHNEELIDIFRGKGWTAKCYSFGNHTEMLHQKKLMCEQSLLFVHDKCPYFGCQRWPIMVTLKVNCDESFFSCRIRHISPGRKWQKSIALAKRKRTVGWVENPTKTCWLHSLVKGDQHANYKLEISNSKKCNNLNI